jgi:hypothetical protein
MAAVVAIVGANGFVENSSCPSFKMPDPYLEGIGPRGIYLGD